MSRLFATPWTVAHQAPLSMEFSRQEYWSMLPFTSPGDLPNPGNEPRSPALQADSLLSEPLGKLVTTYMPQKKKKYSIAKRCKLSSEPSVSCNLLAIITSKITDYRSRNNDKSNEHFEIVQESPKCNTETQKVSKCC